MQVQQEIAFEFNESLFGKSIDVIIDHAVPNQNGAWVGRTIYDAPDVDGIIFVTEQATALKPGDIVPTEVVGRQGYDLIGVAVDSPR